MKKRYLRFGVVLLVFGFSLCFCKALWAGGHEGGLGEKRIHVNIANVEQLLKVEGMTPEIAEAIVTYREETGVFKKPEDLLKVPGITPDVYDTLNPQVGAEGDLYLIPGESGDADGDEEDEDVPMSPSKC